MKLKVVISIFSILAIACNTPSKERIIHKKMDVTPIEIQYATGFRVSVKNGYSFVEVPKPYQGAEEGFKYLLVPRGQAIPDHENDVQVVEVPLQSIACTSTTHIPLLDYINETESLVGFTTTDYISSEKMRKRVDAGLVTELGIDKEMNMERLLELDPEAVMGYTITGDYGQFRKMNQAGIPILINAEYLEKHPLGRAEWIKFMALFFDKSYLADSVFKAIENNYQNMKAKAAKVDSMPTLYSGVVYGDTWYLPGGKNNAAKLFADAGAHYLWQDSTTGFLELSFESVYEKAHDAGYWVGVASFNSLEEIKEADQRYSRFSAFKKGNVYSYNARIGATGGNEYLELGYLRPDLILADLIKIFHPELLPDHELYFHEKLN
ncbi:ABC transporter substrate-binding protein [Fulvivirga sp. 29W222]|uniref:ABC transporter substrate-binding protein n=1 Tax=Fulvivirga marina TaxID=2494733 RepID=A0A937KBK0_9BACT|nr:ABC transporter substrate-binding protein [Fulvivirga marina]MBL6447016.1 ABC transporter substrate-binding protein [Fulvivirga marina]